MSKRFFENPIDLHFPLVQTTWKPSCCTSVCSLGPSSPAPRLQQTASWALQPLAPLFWQTSPPSLNLLCQCACLIYPESLWAFHTGGLRRCIGGSQKLVKTQTKKTSQKQRQKQTNYNNKSKGTLFPIERL